MQFIRPFDYDAGFDSGLPGHHAQILVMLESALLVATTIEEGGCGPGLHYHLSDQLYYLLHGRMNVRLGDVQQQIEPGTLVYIPAGVAHCNWNNGPGTEIHLEMLIPTPAVGSHIAIPVDTPSDVPVGRRAARAGWVRSTGPSELTNAMSGVRWQPLVDRSMGAEMMVVNYVEVAPRGSRAGMHVHDFDQFYLIIEGELTVEVGLARYIARPDTLVVLPAGVPHRQCNEGLVIERHLAISTPAPALDGSWGQGVDFALNGDGRAGAPGTFLAS